MQQENKATFEVSYRWISIHSGKIYKTSNFVENDCLEEPFETKSPVFPDEFEAARNAGHWYLKVIVSESDIRLQLCLYHGEMLNYYLCNFEVNIQYLEVAPVKVFSDKSTFHIMYNREHSSTSIMEKTILKYFKKANIRYVKILFKMNVQVDKCINNALLKGTLDFEKLINDPEFSNFKIITSGKEFKVHKNILAARSEVFSAMVKNEMREKQEGIVQITDFSDEVVHELLRYIYCGRVQDLNKLAEELLRAADKYSMDDLKSICLEEICKEISVENALNLLSLVDFHKVDYLKKYILYFIVINIKEFDRSQFKSLDSNLSKDILLKLINFNS